MNDNRTVFATTGCTMRVQSEGISRSMTGRALATQRAVSTMGCLCGALILIAGCGGSSSLNQGTQTTSSASAKIVGKIFGGQQPLQGAAVQLYAAGSAGYGSGSRALTAVVYTDMNGNFSISGYTCPSDSALTYLTANGGSPGPGISNSAITLMAALGSCGNLNSSTHIVLDEVTTVASVWALAPFIEPGEQVGTSPTNSQGLVNAFANVN